MRDLNEFLTKGGGSTSKVKRFDADGTFTVPKDVYTLYLRGVGGGGGGGGGNSLRRTSVTNVYTAGGGSSGVFANMYPVRVYPGQVIPITIGQGGKGGVGALIKATDNRTNMSINGKTGTSGTPTILGKVLTLAGGGGGGATNTVVSKNSQNLSYPAEAPTLSNNEPNRFYPSSSIDRNKINNKKVPNNFRVISYYHGAKQVESGLFYKTLFVGYAIGTGGTPSVGSPLEDGMGADGGIPKAVYRNYDAIAGNGGDAIQFGTGGGGGGSAFCDRGNRNIVQGGKGGDGKRGFLEIYWQE